MAYIEGEKATGCIFCVDGEEARWRERLILAMTPFALVMLNRFPYNNGHLLVAPRTHKARLEDLTTEEFFSLMGALRRSVVLVNQALQPQGMNLGMNLGRCAGAGVEDHLHWHVVPRWEGDTNFMPVVGAVKVLPQHLMESYDRLQPFFAAFQE